MARKAIMVAKEISVKKYVVTLVDEERERLETLIRKGKSPAKRLLKARILLKDETSKQLIAETRVPIQMQAGRPARSRLQDL
jgi:hypothetical protein